MPRAQLCPYCCGPILHRSDKDHGMFWAVTHRAYESWPVDHDFLPRGVYHLYGWLLIKAGHHETPIEIETAKPEHVIAIVHALFPAIKRKVHCILVEETPKGVTVFASSSFSYREAGKRKYEEVRTKYYEIIADVLGVPVEQLKREAQRDAA